MNLPIQKLSIVKLKIYKWILSVDSTERGRIEIRLFKDARLLQEQAKVRYDNQASNRGSLLQHTLFLIEAVIDAG